MPPTELLLPVVNEENSCLPLSVNVVAKYWNVHIPLPTDAARVYPSHAGSIIIEGIELAEAHGLAVSIMHSDVSRLREAIDASIPPIVVLPGVGNLTHHLSVISGYDDDTITHYIPKSSEEGIYEGVIPWSVFESKWAQEGQIAILISTKDSSAMPTSKSLRLCFDAERAAVLGRRQQGMEMLDAAIGEDDSNSVAWLLLASMQNEEGRGDCTKSYRECIRINPSCYLAYRGMGNYLLKMKRYNDAEESYNAAIRIDPERSGSVYKNRAYLREKRGEYAGAADDLAEYVRLSPDAADAVDMKRAVDDLRNM